MTKLFGLLSIFLFLATAHSASAAARWVPYECGFSTPHLHRDQSWGVYVAHGQTREEARQRTVNLCKSELEAYFPGKCDELAADYQRWDCEFMPRWEF